MTDENRILESMGPELIEPESMGLEPAGDDRTRQLPGPTVPSRDISENEGTSASATACWSCRR
ncbi:hypothetical protein HALLA_04290 (plasmid) [Halostagnicola larsenii XH-48]|uniref:Uncharacterized protein n=1 Tax=Halostagnicola larsenii XH-48 TaxID=797299 RepID=W0JWK6_9EURY|nr:hypothetical protein [Halostagnicola larsenii]AHG01625.1 hypothetical protein HALLA_04290 [Halostagnicola larsenii XH-48]